MSWSMIAWIVGGVISHSLVAVLALMYGKAHPAIQSAIADEASKVAKKIGG
jgi:hypothetical protein